MHAFNYAIKDDLHLFKLKTLDIKILTISLII